MHEMLMLGLGKTSVTCSNPNPHSDMSVQPAAFGGFTTIQSVDSRLHLEEIAKASCSRGSAGMA